MTPAEPHVFLDGAALSLYLFFAFFAGLIYYLRTEDKREGYPLVSDRETVPRPPVHGFPGVPKPKVFLLPHAHGGPIVKRVERDISAFAVPSDPFPGAPLIPTVDPMKAGIGAASWCDRTNLPDMTWDDNSPKVVPLRVEPLWDIFEGDPEIRGRPAVGCDGKVAGVVVDLWVDKSEVLFRYVEIETTDGRHTLVPIAMTSWSGDGPVRVEHATARQIMEGPVLTRPDQVTLKEEDIMSAYYGGGQLHATPDRSEPLI